MRRVVMIAFSSTPKSTTRNVVDLGNYAWNFAGYAVHNSVPHETLDT